MKEILKSRWNYILYKDNDQYILSVVCGTVAIFDRNIRLNEEEKESFKLKGEKYIEELSNEIRNNPDQFEKRHIKLTL